MPDLPKKNSEFFQYLNATTIKANNCQQKYLDSHPELSQDDFRRYWYVVTKTNLINYQLQVYLGRDILEGTNYLDKGFGKELTEDERFRIVKDYDTEMRVGLEVKFFSVTEAFFRSLYIKLTGEKIANPYKIFEYILSLDEQLNEYKPLLKIHRLARNSIHNYGVYWPTNFENDSVEWQGVEYKFEVGKLINDIANHGFLVNYIDNYLDLVDLLTALPQIDKIDYLPSINWETYL